MFGSKQKRVSVWRNCSACGGTGRGTPLVTKGPQTLGGGDDVALFLLGIQGTCLACKGRGGQHFDVLEGSPDAPKV